MDDSTRGLLDNLRSPDGDLRYEAMNAVLEMTDDRVGWAYEVWGELLEMLGHAGGHQRAIAAQVLCNLAKSDPEGRMLTDFDAVLAVTRDEKFVTARHTLQSLWKVGAAGGRQRALVLDRLSDRFAGCADEKHHTLIRYDIIEGLRRLYDEVGDEGVRARALALIEAETDEKYRKKYATLWRPRR